MNENQAKAPEAAKVPVAISSTKPNPDKFPDLSQIQKAVLSDTQRVRKVASHTVIRSRHTNEIHHDAVTIKTWRKSQAVCKVDADHSISLTGEGDDEIHKLITFLLAVRKGTVDASGEYVVMDAKSLPDPEAFQAMLNNISAAGKAETLAAVLQAATDDKKVFDALIERASKNPAIFAEAAAALNVATYKAAVRELETLIATPGVRENKFQAILAKYPWMFGSEYSKVLDRRRFTRDENQDFVVRRTADGYLELVEIKTPLDGAPLFNHDLSHDSYYPSADLAKVLGQVQKYIEKLDAARDSIRANDKEDTNKIRAKVVIGRDGDDNQTAALRTLNGHLHRIEIMTFDQLLRIAQRVIAYLESSLENADDQ